MAAQKALAVSSPQTRAHFEAYAHGVNAYIESHRDRLPIEFRILRNAPRPWTQEDSTLIAAQMVKDLNHYSYRDALDREKILTKLGPELTADLYVNSSWHDRPPTPARPRLEQNTGSEEDEQDKHSPVNSSVAQHTETPSFHDLVDALASHGFTNYGLAQALEPDSEASVADARPVVGSNNWVVSGAHTVSGKPLLSNDMHLGHQMPNLWYEAHLRCGESF